MEKALSYGLSAVFYFLFGLTLVVFQPIQWLCLRLFGYQAHKKSVSILNWFLIRCTHVLGTRYTYSNPHSFPENRPIIMVCNHQSMYDIPPIIWFLRRYHPKFVSKKELGKGIPSVSFNLRHGGSVLIDRKDTQQSLAAIRKLGEYICRHNRSAVIFPEGTRSRDGKPKPFKRAGLTALLESAPTALVVPITIKNSWKFHKFSSTYPLGLGIRVIHQVHPAMEIQSETEAFIEQLERIVHGTEVSQEEETARSTT